MKRLVFLSTLLLMSWTLCFSDETITVSATGSDIAQDLDLKVVAKLFAESSNLEVFEQKLNDPDSAFCNLDLNGDGEVDYLRVIESGEGAKRLIILQAVLAKDIYQDVASIYVEKKSDGQVTMQVIGEERIYGANYIVEPVFWYRPVIYDWFWSPYWVCWHSPFYWDYWPHWWFHHRCLTPIAYHHHCYHFYSDRRRCSYRNVREVHPSARAMVASSGLSRQDWNGSRTRDNVRAAAPVTSSAPVTSRSNAAREMATDRGVSGARVERTPIVKEERAHNSGLATEATPSVSRTFGSSNIVNASSVGRDVSRSTNSSAETKTNTSSRSHASSSANVSAPVASRTYGSSNIVNTPARTTEVSRSATRTNTVESRTDNKSAASAISSQSSSRSYNSSYSGRSSSSSSYKQSASAMAPQASSSRSVTSANTTPSARANTSFYGSSSSATRSNVSSSAPASRSASGFSSGYSSGAHSSGGFSSGGFSSGGFSSGGGGGVSRGGGGSVRR